MNTEVTEEFNIKLLRNLVLWARGEHKRLDKKFRKLGEYNWEQSSWAQQEKNGVCKTSFCMAGAAVVMNGYKIAWDSWNKYSDDTKDRDGEYCYPKGGDKNRDAESIPVTARDLLGITHGESDALFDGDNSLSDIERIAEEICERRGKTLDL